MKANAARRSRRRRATRSSRATSSSRSTRQLHALPRADDRPELDHAAGDLDGRRARADAALRRAERHVHAHQRRRRVPRQRQGLVRAARGEELEPGWKTNIGFHNFGTVLANPLLRDAVLPGLRLDVRLRGSRPSCSRSSLGLLLAIVLDKPGLRFQRFYRSLLIIPYAVPGFLSLLVWQGLLNDDFGVVNRIFHMHIPWLFDAELGEGVGDPRQRLADRAVLLPRLDGRAAVDPGGAERGGARRRRRRAGRSSGGSRCRCCSSRSRRC